MNSELYKRVLTCGPFRAGRHEETILHYKRLIYMYILLLMVRCVAFVRNVLNAPPKNSCPKFLYDPSICAIATSTHRAPGAYVPPNAQNIGYQDLQCSPPIAFVCATHRMPKNMKFVISSDVQGSAIHPLASVLSCERVGNMCSENLITPS